MTYLGYIAPELRPDQLPHNLKVADPSVRDEEKPRLHAQAVAIMAAFRSAPGHRLTNGELSAIARRFGARLHEIRKAGAEIIITERDYKAGVVVYWMVTP
jgi:hypothetical protein